MKHSTPTAPTIKDAIAHIEAHGTASQKQDIRKAKVAFALHGFEKAGLNTFPADLATFEQKVPKLSGAMDFVLPNAIAHGEHPDYSIFVDLLILHGNALDCPCPLSK